MGKERLRQRLTPTFDHEQPTDPDEAGLKMRHQCAASPSSTAMAVDAEVCPVMCIEGHVSRRRPVTRSTVQVKLVEYKIIIDLTVFGWSLEQGDLVSFIGKYDESTGKFIAYGYKNKTKSVYGTDRSDYQHIVYLAIGAIFSLISTNMIFEFISRSYGYNFILSSRLFSHVVFPSLFWFIGIFLIIYGFILKKEVNQRRTSEQRLGW